MLMCDHCINVDVPAGKLRTETL